MKPSNNAWQKESLDGLKLQNLSMVESESNVEKDGLIILIQPLIEENGPKKKIKDHTSG